MTLRGNRASFRCYRLALAPLPPICRQRGSREFTPILDLAPASARRLHVNDIGDTEAIAARTKEYEDRHSSPPNAALSTTSSCRTRRRRRIARALAMLRDKKVEMPAKKHDNLPL